MSQYSKLHRQKVAKRIHIDRRMILSMYNRPKGTQVVYTGYNGSDKTKISV